MRVLRNVASGMGTVRELAVFMWERKLWWLLPFVLTLIVMAALLLIGQVTGASPFIYTLF